MISESEKDKILMPNVINDGIMNVNGNLENRSNSNTNLSGELELYMLQQQFQNQNHRNRELLIQRERDLDIYRSGSAPPTVEGSLNAVGGLFRNPNYTQVNDLNDFTEEEIRSHPAYLAYYYSNENNNPRLPPPLVSKEDWRVAQRVGGGVGSSFGNDWRNKNVVVDEGGSSGSSSLFSMQPGGISVNKAEDELMELRKAATSNLLRKSSTKLIDRGMNSGTLGSRRKSFADIVQDGGAQSSTVENRFSRPSSRNSLSDNLITSVIPNHSTELQNKSSANEQLHPVQMNQPSLSTIGRSNSPGLPNIPNIPNIQNPGTDIANSLAGLNISNNHHEYVNPQLRYLDKSRGKNLGSLGNLGNLGNLGSLGNLVNNSGNVGNSNYPVRENGGHNEQLNFPRRTYSSTSLHDHGFFPEDWNAYNLHGGYHNPATGLASPSGPSLNGRNLGQVGPTLIDPRHVQPYNPRINPIRNFTRTDLQEYEQMCIETLLAAEQKQQQHYHSHNNQVGPMYHNQYHGNPALDLCMPPYHHQGGVNNNHMVVGPTSRMGGNNNGQMRRAASMLNSVVSNGWHNEFDNNSIIEGGGGRVVSGSASTSLEELNNKTKSLELSEVLGHVVEFSTDQYGSRFIQQKLETATIEEKTKIFPEIIPHARSLMTDVFGNYVIQKFFEHGTESQRTELASQLIGYVLPLSLQMYGCRVIQKALEVIGVEQRTQMVAELDGSVMKCVRDQNGNHVIQKCIECVPQDRIQFIIQSFYGQVVVLSMHPYGCRVIQRVLEHCDDPKTQSVIMEEVMHSICTLAQDQYGNYVIQHVLQHGKANERSTIIKELAGQIVKMSQQKFASNVVEKCLTFGSPEERQILVNEMLGSTDENEPLQAMMKDPFGNYVVQKVLETCNDESRQLILSRIRVHLNALKKYTYGKHIVSRVEKLITTGERRKESSR